VGGSCDYVRVHEECCGVLYDAVADLIHVYNLMFDVCWTVHHCDN